MVKFSVRNFAASLACLGIICCAALSLLFFPGLAFPRDLDGKYENSPLKRWFDGLQAGEGFAARSLMARASRLWIGIRRTANIECDLTANGSRCRPSAGYCTKQIWARRRMALQGLRRQDTDQVLYSRSGRVMICTRMSAFGGKADIVLASQNVHL